MKIVFSRKGFDSSVGGVPSPILDDGTLISLPIPDERSSIKYRDIHYAGLSFSLLVEHLTNGALKSTDGVHLDPDIRRSAYRDRHISWRGLFGQVGAAQTHLASQISVGDIFLFFGWFRRIDKSKDRFHYVRNSPDRHMLFGWLQVGAIFLASSVDRPKWTDYHPHCHERFVANASGPNNTLYVASDTLTINGTGLTVPGYGTFKRPNPSLCLTYSDQPKRSIWSLPAWFYPFHSKRTPLTYHSDATRWSLVKDMCLLRTVGRGQEFVLNVDEYPEAVDWLVSLMHDYARGY